MMTYSHEYSLHNRKQMIPEVNDSESKDLLTWSSRGENFKKTKLVLEEMSMFSHIEIAVQNTKGTSA